ncbi:MAG: lipid-binding SYLF domain-containing protein [Pseudoxanthomonas sp.]
MLNVASYKTGPVVVCLSLLLAACATESEKQAEKQEETRATADAAAASLTRFLRDPDMPWLRQNISKARAVMSCPNIFQAGFIVGGSGGRCIVVARTAAAPGWNGPASYRITTGSIGLQAGAQSSEMVALVMTEKALNSLLSNSFKLGADVSVAAGPVGSGAGSQINADIVSFVRSKGLYGGLNIDGSVITIDEEGNRALYGRPVTPVDILVKGSVRGSGTSIIRALEGAGS